MLQMHGCLPRVVISGRPLHPWSILRATGVSMWRRSSRAECAQAMVASSSCNGAVTVPTRTPGNRRLSWRRTSRTCSPTISGSVAVWSWWHTPMIVTRAGLGEINSLATLRREVPREADGCSELALVLLRGLAWLENYRNWMNGPTKHSARTATPLYECGVVVCRTDECLGHQCAC
jgi:hypothetical protein